MADSDVTALLATPEVDHEELMRRLVPLVDSASPELRPGRDF